MLGREQTCFPLTEQSLFDSHTLPPRRRHGEDVHTRAGRRSVHTIQVYPTKQSSTSGKLRPFFQLIKETNPSKLMLGTALFLSIATTLVSLAIPLFTKDLIDGFALSSVSSGQIAFLAGAFIAQAVSSGLSIYMLNHVGQSIVAALRDAQSLALSRRRRCSSRERSQTIFVMAMKERRTRRSSRHYRPRRLPILSPR